MVARETLYEDAYIVKISKHDNTYVTGAYAAIDNPRINGKTTFDKNYYTFTKYTGDISKLPF